MKREVYLDNAATTPLSEDVLEVMAPYQSERYANPSSFHMKGKEIRDAIDAAREQIAEILHVRSDEILFTSGGTESDNLAILGYARANQEKGKHLIISAFEHHAVLEAAQYLERKEGFELTLIEPNKEGLISADDVLAAIRPDTILVSIMYANNEIGTIQPIADIGKEIQRKRKAGEIQALFHTDACQASEYLELDTTKIHVDMLTLNGSKMHGPKGIGILYIRRGVKLTPLQFGGAQERAIRPGTENVAGIVGLSHALKLAQKNRHKYTEQLLPLREKLIEGILSSIPKTRLNGSKEERLANNVNISFMDIEGEALLLYLDAQGVYASTGSACTSASLDPSHVILALGMPYEVAHGSIRFSLGKETTEEDIDYVLEVLPELVEKLRAISPVSVDEKYYE